MEAGVFALLHRDDVSVHNSFDSSCMRADGYYREGTHADEMAKTKGIRALQVEKQRQEAEAKQRRELQVSFLPSSAKTWPTP